MNEPVLFDAPAVERGVGFFETVLLVGRRAILWDEHVTRLLGTLSRLELPAPTRDALDAAAGATLDAAPAQATSTAERALRVAWLAVGPDLEAASAWRLDASVRPIPETTLARRGGSRCVVLPPELRRDTPDVKSTSYFGAVMGLRLARRRGGDEGLFVAEDGTVVEGTSTALLAYCGGGFVRPSHGALPSVTAAAFARLEAEGRVLPASLSPEALRRGAVVLGSLTKAAPMVSVDGAACDVPGAMRERIERFNDRLVTDRTLGTLL